MYDVGCVMCNFYSYTAVALCKSRRVRIGGAALQAAATARVAFSASLSGAATGCSLHDRGFFMPIRIGVVLQARLLCTCS